MNTFLITILCPPLSRLGKRLKVENILGLNFPAQPALVYYLLKETVVQTAAAEAVPADAGLTAEAVLTESCLTASLEPPKWRQ